MGELDGRTYPATELMEDGYDDRRYVGFGTISSDALHASVPMRFAPTNHVQVCHLEHQWGLKLQFSILADTEGRIELHGRRYDVSFRMKDQSRACSDDDVVR